MRWVGHVVRMREMRNPFNILVRNLERKRPLGRPGSRWEHIVNQMHPVHTYPPISLRSILISSSHLHLGLPNGLFPSGLLTNILYPFLISPVRATWPANFTLLDLIILIIYSSTSML